MTDNLFNPMSVPLTLPETFEAFDKISAMADISFYPAQGCFERAEVMCVRLREMHIAPFRAYAFRGEQPLKITRPDGKIFEHDYHVAAAVRVCMPDGKVDDLVIDPALFDGPVTLAQWGAALKVSDGNGCLQITEMYEAPQGYYAIDSIKKAAVRNSYHESLSTTMDNLVDDERPRVVFPTPLRPLLAQKPPVIPPAPPLEP